MKKVIIWIASGEKYINEAVVSVESVESHNPSIDKMLFVNDYSNIDCSNYSFVVNLLPNRQYDLWYLNSTLFLSQIISKELATYDQILLLDTDTYICDDLSDYFTILDRFDIVGTHAPGRQTAPTVYNVPPSFPDMHIGALSFNNNNQIRELFNSWGSLYKLNQGVYGQNDQAPLRDALWMRDISCYAMPPEYCFRFQFGGQVKGKVKILHGRSRMSYKEIEQEVNREWGKIRVFQRGMFR